MSDRSAKVLRGHSAGIRGLTYDPEGEMLASASSDGTIKIWKLEDDSCVKTLAILESRADALFKMDWHPNGKFIAIPIGNQIHVYERDSWDLSFSFSGEDGHSKNVAMAVWSPNGEYLASVSTHGEIIVWETQSKQTLGRFKHQLAVCSVAWHPGANEILWADTHGKFAIWKEPVPEATQFAAPTGGDEVSQATATVEKLTELFDDDEDEVKPKKRPQLKRLQTKIDDDSSDDDSDDGMNDEAKDKKKAAKKEKAAAQYEQDNAADFDEADYAHLQAPAVELQDPFMPSSSPLEETRRFLVWNDIGVITAREDEFNSSIDIEFANVQKQKPIRMKDHIGFTVGALSEQAFVLGAPSRMPQGEDQRENPSVLFCQNVAHWSTDATWRITFEDEEVEVIAVGGGMTGFVAAATSKRYLRLYSMNGVARHIMCLDGPIVSMSAKEEQLIAVYHFGLGTNSDQSMSCMLVDVDERKVLHKDRLPMRAGATLSWLGFSDDGVPAMMDSTSTVCMLLNEWSYTWTPIVELEQQKKQKGDSFWMIGLTQSEALCVVCKGGRDFPDVLPRPMLSTKALQMPVVSRPYTQKMEENFLRSKINFEHVVRVEELDMSEPEERKQIMRSQGQMDLHLIHCISQAVQRQMPGLALDLTTSLNLSKSIDTAIKLAVKKQMPMLAERMSLAKMGHMENKQKAAAKARAAQTEYLDRPAYPSPPASALQQRRRPPSSASRLSSTTTTTPLSSGRKVLVTSRQSEKRTISQRDRAISEEPSDGEDAEQDEEPQDRSARATTTAKASPLPSNPKTTSNPFSSNPFAKKASPKASSDRSALGNTSNMGGEDADEKPKKKVPSFLKQAGVFRQKKKEADDGRALKRTKKDAAAPKKPLSSYMLWLKTARGELKKEFPDVGNKGVLVKAGERWKAMEETEKTSWGEKAKDLKAAYTAELNTYLAGDSAAAADTMGSEPAAVAEVGGTGAAAVAEAGAPMGGTSADASLAPAIAV